MEKILVENSYVRVSFFFVTSVQMMHRESSKACEDNSGREFVFHRIIIMRLFQFDGLGASQRLTRREQNLDEALLSSRKRVANSQVN